MSKEWEVRGSVVLIFFFLFFKSRLHPHPRVGSLVLAASEKKIRQWLLVPTTHPGIHPRFNPTIVVVNFWVHGAVRYKGEQADGSGSGSAAEIGKLGGPKPGPGLALVRAGRESRGSRCFGRVWSSKERRWTAVMRRMIVRSLHRRTERIYIYIF